MFKKKMVSSLCLAFFVDCLLHFTILSMKMFFLKDMKVICTQTLSYVILIKISLPEQRLTAASIAIY